MSRLVLNEIILQTELFAGLVAADPRGLTPKKSQKCYLTKVLVLLIGNCMSHLHQLFTC